MTTPGTLSTVAVIGNGLIGHGVAQVFAAAGKEVRLIGRRDASLRSAMETIKASLKSFADYGLMTPTGAKAAIGRIWPTTDMNEAAAATLVVEAVLFVHALQLEVFEALDRITVSGTRFAVDGNTQITLDGHVTGLADLKVGDPALVCFVLRNGGLPPLATSIQATSGITIVAGGIAVIAADDTTFEVGSTTMSVDATTVYGGSGDPKSLADFKVGDGVGVRAVKRSDGTLLATSVTRFDLVGAIEGTAAPNLTVAGRTITTTSTTTFSDLASTALTFGASLIRRLGA